MATEKLKFKIELYATMWNKAPRVEVKLNDTSYFKDNVSATEEKTQIIEFEHECENGHPYDLNITLSEKDIRQTKIGEKGEVLKDQLLHIKSIEIDEIDVGALIYKGVYTPEYPELWASQQREAGTELKESFKNATDLGHNGTWRFKFSSPFYMWLLENLY